MHPPPEALLADRAAPAAARSEAGPGAAPLGPKARQILAGARSAFHDLGYEGTSVDEIARRAGVSKPTLYTHFGDKQALFAASFTQECREYSERTFKPEEMGTIACVEAGLRASARSLVGFLLSPFAQSMFRSAVAEAARFPDLGRAYYEAGPKVGKMRIKEILEHGVALGFLAIDDTDLAAHQFMQLCKADFFMKQLFFVEGPAVDEAEIARIADGAVKLFLNGYRRRGAGADGEAASG